MESCGATASMRSTRRAARRSPLLVVSLLACLAVACAAQSPPPSGHAAHKAPSEGRTGQPGVPTGPTGRSHETRRGRASFIADSLDGRRTASGAPYDKHSLVAAHPSYPLGTVLRVTNLENGRVVDVTIVDRTASPAARRHRMIDLSRAAAERLGFISRGTARVTTEVLQWGERRGAR